MVRLEGLWHAFHFLPFEIFRNYILKVAHDRSVAGNLGRILSFSERLGIAIDVAHGLTYLHMYSGDEPGLLFNVTSLVVPHNLDA